MLRHQSKPLVRVDAELKKIVREMFDLMYEANGVGLAANQVDLPMRLFIVNAVGKPDEGEEYVFINPVVSKPKGTDEKEEGCLSLPGFYGEVTRPARIHVSAYNLEGEELEADLEGLLARVVQHETDHLDGVLFIDRLSTTASMDMEPPLSQMQNQYEERVRHGDAPDEDAVAERLAEWENNYC
jgi:peptide deformylase